jgi:hypothetical protein
MVVQFMQLFAQEQHRPDERKGKDDIVITDTQCKPP